MSNNTLGDLIYSTDAHMRYRVSVMQDRDLQALEAQVIAAWEEIKPSIELEGLRSKAQRMIERFDVLLAMIEIEEITRKIMYGETDEEEEA